MLSLTPLLASNLQAFERPMASDPSTAGAHQADGEPRVSTAVRGIIEDAVELMRQQLLLLKAELRADVRKAAVSIALLAGSIGPLLMGMLMFCLMFVHLLHWATLPSEQLVDPATLPLWTCYGIVGGAFALVGAGLLSVGVYRFKHFHPFPEESARALEENIQWLMNRNPK